MEKESKKYLKNIIKKYEKYTTDYWRVEEYQIADYLYKLIDENKKLKIMQENTARELINRTNKYYSEVWK